MHRPLPPVSLRWLAGLLLLLIGATAALAAPGTFDPVAETEKLLATLPAAQRLRSDAYFEGGYWLLLWEPLVTLLIAWLLYRTGLAVRLRDTAERVFKRRFLQAILFVALLSMILWAMNLPWGFYTGFIREHQYGLSNQTAGAWLGESLIGLVPTLFLSCPVGALLYLAIRRSPQRWWLAASAATPFFLLLLIVIAPVFIAPLFNTYQPLTDTRVRDPILSMARANGVPVDNVYQFDASKQTNRISANVNGAFRTIRVSLNDNLLTRCSPEEVQAVMAHELGHYVLNHVYKLVIYLSLLFAAGFAFTHYFFAAVVRRWGARWSLRGIDDLAGLPLLLAGLSIFLLLAAPIQNTIIRTTESEADIFGLNAARQPDAFATAALKVADYRKLAPGRWEEIALFDHPSGRQRILMAMQWKAENLAEIAAKEEN
ncbi:MAG: M48 family metallopeptidase [Opitutaceae bacterium]|nr:M48 family metallopeptidase [Opitutaceae bacterium]